MGLRGPLPAIVFGAPAVGEVIIWRMAHPRAPLATPGTPEPQAGPPRSATGSSAA